VPALHLGGPGSSLGQVMWDVMDKAALGQVFLQVLRFPLPIISLIAPHSSSSIIRDWYISQLVASAIVNSVPLRPKKGEKRPVRLGRKTGQSTDS
jgi:hypothetical protein